MNVPIKGAGIKVVKDFYSNGSPLYSLMAPNGGIIAELTLLDVEDKEAQAKYIAEAISLAVEIGFKQGQAHVREAMGINI